MVKALASMGEILGVVAALIFVILLIKYGGNILGGASKNTQALNEKSSEIMKGTIDKVTAETFLDGLTFTWTKYEIDWAKGTATKIESESGSWDDLNAYINNLGSNGVITTVIVYADTSVPTLPVKSASIKLAPYATSGGAFTSNIPFGYGAFYSIIKANPDKTIYFVIGTNGDKYQVVAQVTYIKT